MSLNYLSTCSSYCYNSKVVKQKKNSNEFFSVEKLEFYLSGFYYFVLISKREAYRLALWEIKTYRLDKVSG